MSDFISGNMLGQEIGNYRIVDRLGDGGMGSVYRAVDRMLDREVAIKVLRADLSRNGLLVERFRQEARALARLNHPGIAILHGLEQHNGELLMIMEYVRGETLEAIVHRSGRIAWERAATLCIAVLDALDHAHDMGVVHRDMKPSNVMLAHNGVVKVMDFGIARMKGHDRQTRTGHAVGTPMYMAPEQLKGLEVDGRTDVYAMGAVLFELITGEMAFNADSDYALMMKKLSEVPVPPSSMVADVPAEIDAAVMRAMATEPSDRFPNAMAFARELERILALRSSEKHATSRAKSPPMPAPETRLAMDSGSSVPADLRSGNTAGGVEPTRVATPETRVEANTPARELPAHDVAPTRVAGFSDGRSETMAKYLSDWRSYVAAAAILVAATLGMKFLRSSPEDRGSLTSSGSVALNNSPSPASDSTSTKPVGPAPETAGEDLASLRVAPGTGGVPRGTGPGGGSVRSAPPSNERPADPPASSEEKVAPPQSSQTVTSQAQVTNAPTPSREAIRDAICAVVDNALHELNQPDRAEALLAGSIKQDWVALAREKRISAGSSIDLDAQVDGSHAVATFASEINVRTPFGANRKRTGRFNAELRQDGEKWRVLRIQVLGSLSLK